MKVMRSVLAIATAALVAAIAAPVGAMPSGASVESYKIDGVIAMGSVVAPRSPQSARQG